MTNTQSITMNRPFIKSKRALLDMTQADLAAALGLNDRSLSRYLNQGTLPITALFAMADLFGCKAEDLVIR